MTWVPAWRGIAVAALLAAVLGPASGAGAQVGAEAPVQTNFLAADATEAGIVSLFFFGAQGAQVEFYERIGERLAPLGRRTAPAGQPTVLREATMWDCDRLERHFFAFTELPGGGYFARGSYSVRTGSCAHRFELRVPTRVRPGRIATIRIVDQWGNGDTRPQLCITAPRERRSCRTLRFRRAVSVLTRRVRPQSSGRIELSLRIRSFRTRATIVVGDGPGVSPPPVLLATGDSTMQGVDSFLADELGSRATVRSEVRPGSGISKSTGWSRLARSQVRRLRPRTTVITIGAADGAAMTTRGGEVVCCDEPWVSEYARRVRAIMRTYVQRGRGRVLWMTLPLPRGPTLVADAINTAILRAADGLARATVLRMDTIFTPDGYRDVMPYRGRTVRVREDDGIHLNVAGTAIAAREIARAVRAR